ncbi:tripartite motif-containing protein 59 isoform X1 [Takifugu flavidus]|uniref:Tripartite motif-containing protein 59 n=2 Tax=Takifugu flavidus TaxID=433684 RepID=A0A5C6PFQ2_9TELE|nr:tripartite motif-containing protein 59 isoform X1 [Takifugu flavidus]TWW77147.1 Tripartite motif-containing protein 59 [Takifugu flavidus]
METLEEDLTCSVCYSLFSDPRVLPCSHTFCKTCLDNLLQVSNNYSIWRPLRLPLKCPNCRSMVELPPTGVEALPSNVSLRAIIEKYQSDNEPRPPSCQEHHRQPLNMYCIQDRQLICGLCLTVGQHQGHPIDDLQAAFTREKRTPSLLLAKLSESRWAQVCELGEQLEQEKARCEDLLRQDRHNVSQYFHSLEVVLAKKRRACLDALDKAAGEVCRAYDPLIHKVKELQEEQLDLVSFGSLVEEEESPLVFLEKVHLFRERVEEFTACPLPSVVNMSLTPRAADFLQQHWASVSIQGLEDAPVPKVCCCARCGSIGAAVEAETGGGEPDGQGQDQDQDQHSKLWAVPLLGLLLLGLLWANLDGRISLDFTWFPQLVHSLSGETMACLCGTAQALYATIGSHVEIWGSYLSAVGQKSIQHLALLLDSLTPT